MAIEKDLVEAITAFREKRPDRYIDGWAARVPVTTEPAPDGRPGVRGDLGEGMAAYVLRPISNPGGATPWQAGPSAGRAD